MRLKKYLAALAATVAVAVPVAWGAGLWQTLPVIGSAAYCASANVSGNAQGGITGLGGTQPAAGQTTGTTICGQTAPAGPPALTGNEVIPADLFTPGTSQQGGGPATALIPVPALGNFWATPRNYLRNGALDITNTNGTSTVTCATTSALTTAALSADRWGCDANVSSGAGRTAIVTSTPTPPTGFTNVMKVFRTSGSLAQPICVMQEIPTAQTTELQGQVVTFSAFVTGLAGLVADNNGTMNLVLFYGTGTDQGLSTAPTASPAITLAWTGVTTIINQQFTIVTTPVPALTFQRIAATATVPAAATELAAALCFTPTTTTSGGATDGFAFTGAQLERSPVMSNYEFSPKSYESISAQQFFYSISDTAGPSPVIGLCTETTANTAAACWIQYPVPMYLAPTVTLTGCGTACFAMPTTTAQTAVTSTCVLTVNATFTYIQGVQGTYLQCAQSGTTAAVGIALPLMMSTSATNSGRILAWTGL